MAGWLLGLLQIIGLPVLYFEYGGESMRLIWLGVLIGGWVFNHWFLMYGKYDLFKLDGFLPVAIPSFKIALFSFCVDLVFGLPSAMD